MANLLLVRGSLRQRELAIRSAIGAGPWDLARQILSEALLLAAIGALGGFGLAWVGIHELLAIAPAYLPRLDTISIDSAVLVFTIVSSLAAAAIFGLAPAWRAARPDVMLVLDVRAAIKAFDPHLLITDMQPMDAVIEKAQAGTRFSLILIASFAVIAALLAGVGLYGVLATVVRQRTAEIGIRMTLGLGLTEYSHSS